MRLSSAQLGSACLLWLSRSGGLWESRPVCGAVGPFARRPVAWGRASDSCGLDVAVRGGGRGWGCEGWLGGLMQTKTCQTSRRCSRQSSAWSQLCVSHRILEMGNDFACCSRPFFFFFYQKNTQGSRGFKGDVVSEQPHWGHFLLLRADEAGRLPGFSRSLISTPHPPTSFSFGSGLTST